MILESKVGTDREGLWKPPMMFSYFGFLSEWKENMKDWGEGGGHRSPGGFPEVKRTSFNRWGGHFIRNVCRKVKMMVTSQ